MAWLLVLGPGPHRLDLKPPGRSEQLSVLRWPVGTTAPAGVCLPAAADSLLPFGIDLSNRSMYYIRQWNQREYTPIADRQLHFHLRSSGGQWIFTVQLDNCQAPIFILCVSLSTQQSEWTYTKNENIA